MSKRKNLRFKYKPKKKKAPKFTITAVQATTNALTKKGKIKGKNKKETKILKASCCHHFYDKDGEKIPPIFNNNDGTRKCELCKAEFSSHFYSNSEIKSVFEPTLELMNQMKFMAVAVGADDKTVSTIVKTYVSLNGMPKLYKNLRKVAASKSRVKKNKKGKKFASQQYGAWR